MTEFRAWAPERERVEVELGGRHHDMVRAGRGWWRTIVPTAQPGDDYRFRLDGDKSLPDPRSKHQPKGVHGPSRIVDLNQFQWMDNRFRARPLSSGLLYELHVGTFTPAGTFEAIIEKIPHLLKLGVTYVELMPIAAFAGSRGWGYDGAFPFAPHDAYGGPQGLLKLVNELHAADLAVILDVVYNYLGPSGNYLPEYGPYFTDRHTTPWGTALSFDGPYSDDVREYFIDNARMWFRDYHFDGLRLDAVHAIVDTSATPFLEQLSQEVRHLEAQLGRPLALIAESDLNDPRIVRPHEIDGFGIHAQWNDDFHHAVHAALTQEQEGYYSDYGRVEDLATVFKQPYLYAGRFSAHRLRSHGRAPEGVHASSFVSYSQHHDQVGNRATGERLHQLLPVDYAKIAAALTVLSPYVPMLFQGEEWTASNPFQYFVDFSEEPELAAAVSESKKKEFALNNGSVPDPRSIHTFEDSKLNWDDLKQSTHTTMLDWYRALVEVRRHPALVDGRLDRVKIAFNENERWFLIKRAKTVLVVNLGEQTRTIEYAFPAGATIEICSGSKARVSPGSLSMPPRSVALVVSTRSVSGNVHA